MVSQSNLELFVLVLMMNGQMNGQSIKLRTVCISSYFEWSDEWSVNQT